MSTPVTYESILKDKALFDGIVYTPLSQALVELEERRKDPELLLKIKKLLNNNVPEIMHTSPVGVQFRQIATPNHETRRFVSIAKDNNLKPVLFEYHDDKFTSNNEYKHSLGRIHINNGLGKKGGEQVEKITIVDFNVYNGKKLHEVKTLWSESLVDFHKNLFSSYGIDHDVIHFFEASEWFKANGGSADKYYFNFFLLFTCFGVLFENFLREGPESAFTRDIVLPAITKVVEVTGVKPLIVPFEPFDMEFDSYWNHHSPHIRNHLK